MNTNKSESADNLSIPVWLHATESFYKKLNRIAKQCGLNRYDALSRGLDALLRETEIRNSALNRNIKSPFAIGNLPPHDGTGVLQLLGKRQSGREAAACTK